MTSQAKQRATALATVASYGTPELATEIALALSYKAQKLVSVYVTGERNVAIVDIKGSVYEMDIENVTALGWKFFGAGASDKLVGVTSVHFERRSA